ncbi:MAG: hypothetical protein J0M00_02535 [Burkholderiales bacterium]|nr:hypothetical protein [Burkholderiales bacterium]
MRLVSRSRSFAARVALALVMAGALAGCSTPYKSPAFASSSGNTRFEGIVDLLEPQRPLDLLFVHGMCTHDELWATGAVTNIYAALGGTEKVELQPVEVEDTGIRLYQQTLSTPRGPIRANAILWSPLTAPLKARLCYDQTDKSKACPPAEAEKAYPYQRAQLNRILKDTILNDCLSDAVIYQGQSRDQINERMQRAVLQAVATSGGQRSDGNAAVAAAAMDESIPLVVVSESLGSKVVFDALFKLSVSSVPAKRAAGQRTFDRTTLVFMGANQVPILALGDTMLDGTIKSLSTDGSSYPRDALAELVASRKARAPFKAASVAAAPLRVVAFTDPNDLLSYILVPSPWGKSYDVVDVVVSNDNTYFGLVELPTTAHQGYRENSTVRRLVACGNPTSGKCQ